MSRVMMLRALSCLAVGVLAAIRPTVSAAQSLTFSKTVSGYDLAKAVNDALAGTAVHLHNLGPLQGATYHADNASSVKWPKAYGPGRRTRFSVPEISRAIAGRKYSYHVAHIRSDDITVKAGTDTLVATLKLSAAGSALLGRCIELRSVPRPCRFLGENTMPAIDWYDAAIEIELKPVVFERSLSFSVESVGLKGRLDIAKACATPVVGQQLCRLIERQTVSARTVVERQIKAALQDIALQREVASAIRTYLDDVAGLPALGVRRVSMSEGNVRIALGFGR